MNKILVILGPTATGKTKLGVMLAKKYNGEIISADSRQVYKGMDIGTGKDKSEYGDIPVWGIDLVDPDYNFNVSEFLDFARAKTKDIQNRGKLPIIVGGAVLYIKALLEPFETINVPKNDELRKELEKLSVEELQKRLGETNLNQSDFNNPRRLIRAIEVKESPSLECPDNPHYDYQIISLTAPLAHIYEQIDKRVDKRLKQGAAEEVKKLLEMGYSLNLPSFTATGYREVNNPELWKQKERQYAKRQITFIKKFLKDKVVIELDATDETAKNSLSL